MGAFDYGAYKAITRAHDDPRLAAACVALKRELAYNGFGQNLVVETPVLGEAFTNRLNDFKESIGMPRDGQAGQKTCSELFKKRTIEVEIKYDLPYGTLGKKVKLESGFDPVAIGVVDPDDTGMCQINKRIHNIPVEDLYDPEFSLNWAGRYVRSNFNSITDRADVMKAARAAYNIGAEYATRWMRAGFPGAGGTFDSSGIDWYARATNYIRLIDNQTW